MAVTLKNILMLGSMIHSGLFLFKIAFDYFGSLLFHVDLNIFPISMRSVITIFIQIVPNPLLWANLAIYEDILEKV